MAEGGYQSHEFTLVKPGAPQGAPGVADTLLDRQGESAPDLPPEAAQKVLALVQALAPEQREAVTLYYFERWPLERVAATMERTPEQIAELLLAAARTLRPHVGV